MLAEVQRDEGRRDEETGDDRREVGLLTIGVVAGESGGEDPGDAEESKEPDDQVVAVERRRGEMKGQRRPQRTEGRENQAAYSARRRSRGWLTKSPSVPARRRP